MLIIEHLTSLYLRGILCWHDAKGECCGANCDTHQDFVHSHPRLVGNCSPLGICVVKCSTHSIRTIAAPARSWPFNADASPKVFFGSGRFALSSASTFFICSPRTNPADLRSKRGTPAVLSARAR